MMEPEINSSQVALYSLTLNIVVALVKGVLAYLTGSASLLAETLHSLSDLVVSFAIWAGVRIACLSSSEFPYGLYKVENMVSLFSAVAIFFAGYEIARKSLEATAVGAGFQYLPVSIAALAAIIVAICLFANYESVKGNDLNSPALKADSSHLKADMASTAVVIVGLVGSALGLRFVDRVAALVVMAFVARTGWRILVDAMRSLLDASVDHATLDNIRSVVLADPRIKAIRSIVARNSGSVIFVSLDLVCVLRSLDDVNDASKELATAVKATVPHVERVQITMEPVQRGYLLVAVPLDDSRGAISEHFGKAAFLAIVRAKKDGLGAGDELEILPNPFVDDDKAKGIRLARYLLEKGVDILYSRESLAGKGPAYVLEAAGVQLRTTACKRLDDFMSMLVAEER